MLISKPSNLNVPPWQMVSALLDGDVGAHGDLVGLAADLLDQEARSRSAAGTGVLKSDNKKPGDGRHRQERQLGGRTLGLIGGQRTTPRSASPRRVAKHYAIFGDLNQQGTINPGKGKCDSSQNGRGGMFFVVKNDEAVQDAERDAGR